MSRSSWCGHGSDRRLLHGSVDQVAKIRGEVAFRDGGDSGTIERCRGLQLGFAGFRFDQYPEDLERDYISYTLGSVTQRRREGRRTSRRALLSGPRKETVSPRRCVDERSG